MKVVEVRHPLVQHKIGLLRDPGMSTKDFREVVNELGTLLAYEATADLRLRDKAVETPLATAQCRELTETIGLVPVLRAGLGMVEGIWEMMPGAEVFGPVQGAVALPHIGCGAADV